MFKTRDLGFQQKMRYFIKIEN